eukprot:gene129-208_t
MNIGVVGKILAAQGICSIIFLLIAVVARVQSTPASFPIIFTAYMYLFYVAISSIIILRRQSVMGLGLVLGSSLLMMFLSLMTAVYWGSLSKCGGYVDKRQPCSNKTVMIFVCIFATILGTLQLMLILELYRTKDKYLADAPPKDLLEPFSEDIASMAIKKKELTDKVWGGSKYYSAALIRS